MESIFPHHARIDYFGCFAPKYFFMAQHISASNSVVLCVCRSDEKNPEQNIAKLCELPQAYLLFYVAL